MNKLKAGDVIDAVSRAEGVDCRDCIFTETTACRFDACIFGKDLILKIRTGPKQGDTVWVKNTESFKWKPDPRVFVVKHGDCYFCEYIPPISNKLLGWNYMTTTDPYALKYELTPQEALVAIGQGKKVRGLDMGDDQYFEWIDGKGITLNGNISWDLDLSMKYAIVEE
jgi:hypothetical protein